MWRETPGQMQNGSTQAERPDIISSRYDRVRPGSRSGHHLGQYHARVRDSERITSRTLPVLGASSEAPFRPRLPQAAPSREQSACVRDVQYSTLHREGIATTAHTHHRSTHYPDSTPNSAAPLSPDIACSVPSRSVAHIHPRADATALPISRQHQRPPLTIPHAFSKSQRSSPTSAVSAHTPRPGESPFGPNSEAMTSAPPALRTMPSLPHSAGHLPGPHAMSRRPLPINTAPSTTQMTVDTPHGQMSIPIDVQGASRVADEKRRRNAGASARFRARRKEKELASTREIDDLKQRIDDLSEDCDFYRQERDVLSAALSGSTEGSRLLPRPTSPRRRRTLIDPSTQSEGSQDSPSAQHFEERGEHGNHGSVSRRRLDTPPQPQYGYYMPPLSQAAPPRHPPTLPPLQMPHQPQSTSPHLPPPRSFTYPGFATAASVPASPWQSGYPSLTHSRSQSSTRSHQSGNSEH